MPINFHTENIDFKLKRKLQLKAWIKSVIETEKKTLGTINYIFCDDGFMLNLNKDYLNHNSLTDIITFDYCVYHKNMHRVNSDIFISIERVQENAKKFDVAFESELQRVMIHGVLHLCGYKDKTAPDKEQMRKMEDKSLKKLRLFSSNRSK